MSDFLSGGEENPHDITENGDLVQCESCGKRATSKRKLNTVKCNGGSD